MASLHLEAKIGDIAETVLMPGDPLRAKFMAETMLEDVVCYNKVRGMYGYTGYYKGKRVSIQGSGMGMGSLSIYAYELINTYNVKNLIRVGTCGAIQKDLALGQVLIAMSASGDSDANARVFKGMHYAATADFDLFYKAVETAKSLNIKTIQGPIFSTNTFYDDEMETQALYTLAKRLGAKGLSILTVSDNILTGASSSQKDREQSFGDMMRIAFEIA